MTEQMSAEQVAQGAMTLPQIMSRRAELRGQWSQDNKDRQRQGLPPVKWSEWKSEEQAGENGDRSSVDD